MLFLRQPPGLTEAPTPTTAAPRSWRYPTHSTPRDLRIDFLRGVVMVVLVVVHFDFFSAWHLLAWERVGVVSGGEGFVILSGVVVGMVYGRRALEGRWRELTGKLWGRAGQLYRVNLAVIAGVALAHWTGLVDASYVMEFTDTGSGTVYPLYPAADAPWWIGVAQALRLQIGPHQFQIMGLYVVLLLATPGALWLMRSGRTRHLLFASVAVYFLQWADPSRPTGAQFEYAFPVLAWQLLFVLGLAVGFHRKAIEAVLARGWRTPVVALGTLGALAFFAWAQNSPRLPDGTHLSLVDPEVYGRIYGHYFQKGQLGILRVVNYACLLTVAYAALTRWWRPLNKAFGWFLIPVGQASLYVFVMHVALLAVWTNVPGLTALGFWGNTVAHAAALMLLWAMVKTGFLFRYVPR